MTPKLPGINGIENFRGHSFHTSRWDYSYTGGTLMRMEKYRQEVKALQLYQSLTKLCDKRVALIGTGATTVQCVPHLAAACKNYTSSSELPVLSM